MSRALGSREITPAPRFTLNPLALLRFISRRMRSTPGLLLAVWAGFTLTTAIITAVPIYAESAGYRILLAALAERARSQTDALPPFAIVYKFGGASDRPVTYAQYGAADGLASDLPGAGIALPAPPSIRYVGTEKVRVGFPESRGREILFARIGMLTGIEGQIQIVQGILPQPVSAGGPIDVLVAESTATKQTLLVDDVYRITTTGSGPQIDRLIRVAGIWRATNPEDPYWFNSPATYSDVLFVPEASLRAVADLPDARLIATAAWYTVLDDTQVRSAGVADLSAQITRLTSDMEQILPGTALDRSPNDALTQHGEQVRVLTVTLALFSVPLLGLIGYFAMQIAGMVVQRRTAEIAVLRSRGGSPTQMVGFALGEGLLLALAAVLAGLPLSLLVAHLLLATESFLRFGQVVATAPELLPNSWVYATIAALPTIPAIVVPTIVASGTTIVSFKSARARALQRPFWQRFYLDLLLLVPAFYGLRQLQLTGSIGIPGLSSGTDDPFRNPLLLLAPALLCTALALLALRLLPGILTLAAAIAGRMPGVSIVTALRFLARTPSAYSDPVLLTALTLSLAVFTASMASTLDGHSADRAAYRAGADARLTQIGAPLTSATIAGDIEPDLQRLDTAQGGAQFGSTGEAASTGGTAYLLVPIEEFVRTSGVRAATRVAPSRAEIVMGTASSVDGIFYGVDRTTLTPVIEPAWRADYDPEPLGALMNRLGESQDSVLISARLAETSGLRTGDRFSVALNDLGPTVNVSVVVAGVIGYFPTLYNEGAPFVIGNLDYAIDQQGAQYPYEVWLETAPDIGRTTVASLAAGYGMRAMSATPAALLRLDLLRPERQGLFGLLSVGFVATMLVTVIGFLVTSLQSFQRRVVELGVLRAIGLDSLRLGALLGIEQTVIVGTGAVLGAGLGSVVSALFIPSLQVRQGVYPGTPPFLVRIPWDQIALVYVVAAVLLAATVLVLFGALRRMRIFEAVKLGETV